MAATLLAIAVCLLSFVFGSSSAAAEPRTDGFSLELIHRDSPRSPFYDARETRAQRLRNALGRSLSRATRLGLAATLDGGDPASHIFSNNGEFLMNVSIGSPPVEVLGVLDTGSDLVWTQCVPCEGCFEQAAPLFDPRGSSSYRDVSCVSSKCKALPLTSCDPVKGETCEYQYTYSDQSFTMGNVATDTLTLSSTSGQPVSFPGVIFGCGHHNAGTFADKASGVIGLGGGVVSLVSQMGEAGRGKFSYCLVPTLQQPDKPSTLSFGSRAAVTGPGAVSTPLVPKQPQTFYHVTLEAVSVGTSKFELKGSDGSISKGNMVVDSGTTLTLLPWTTYNAVETALEGLVKLERVPDPLEILGLCFKTVAGVDFEAPAITFHFTGADVELGTVNTFIEVADDLVCLSFKPCDHAELSLFGNIAQMNFVVGFDTLQKSISFKPMECANF